MIAVIMRASVPSGTIVGKHEAVELRDKDPNNFHGQGKQSKNNIMDSIAVFNFNTDIIMI